MRKVDILLSNTASKECFAKLLLIPKADSEALELFFSDSEPLHKELWLISGMLLVLLPIESKL